METEKRPYLLRNEFVSGPEGLRLTFAHIDEIAHVTKDSFFTDYLDKLSKWEVKFGLQAHIDAMREQNWNVSSAPIYKLLISPGEDRKLIPILHSRHLMSIFAALSEQKLLWWGAAEESSDYQKIHILIHGIDAESTPVRLTDRHIQFLLWEVYLLSRIDQLMGVNS